MSKSGFDELDELAKILGLTEADPERKKAKPDQTKADGPSPEDSEFYPNFSEDDPDFSDEEIPARKEDIPAAEEKPATKGSASEGKSSPSPVSKPPAPPKPPEPRRASSSEDDFITEWVSYGQARTDAPVEFHEIAAYTLIATAINRNRWLELGHKTIYPSIYGLCLADSGERKSTPMDYAEEACPKGLRLANDYSPEALIADLDERQQARGIAFIDEAGRLLGTMRKHQYGEGMKDLLNKLWDTPNEIDRKLMKATFHLESVYLNILMATTRSRFVDVASPEDITSGFLARFLPVIPAEKVKRRPVKRISAEIEDEKNVLIADLGALHTYLAQSPRAMEITDAALEALNNNEENLLDWAKREYHSDLLHPFAFRLSEYGFRLSIIHAVSEDQEIVDLPHALSAIRMVEQRKENARTVVVDLTATKDAREAEKLFQLIENNPPDISRRDVCRRGSLNARRVGELAEYLRDQGRIKIKTEGLSAWYSPVSKEN